MFGPMQLVVVTFSGSDFPEDVRRELKDIREQGFVRLVDAVFVMKDSKSDLLVLEGSDLAPDETEFLDVMAKAFFGYGAAGDAGMELGIEAALANSQDGVFGLGEDDLLEIADRIPVGSAALFMLLEHVWLTGLKEALQLDRGNVVAHGWITPETLMSMGASTSRIG